MGRKKADPAPEATIATPAENPAPESTTPTPEVTAPIPEQEPAKEPERTAPAADHDPETAPETPPEEPKSPTADTPLPFEATVCVSLAVVRKAPATALMASKPVASLKQGTKVTVTAIHDGSGRMAHGLWGLLDYLAL